MTHAALGLMLWLALSAGESVDEISSRVGEVSHDATIGELEAFTAAHPGDPQAVRALLLAAQLRRADGRDDVARALLERAAMAAPGSSFSFDAALALCELDLTERRYDDAITRYQQVLDASSGRWRYQAGLGIEFARAARTRRWVLVALLVALGCLCLWRAARALRAGTLWPMPEEAKIGLPVAALLALCSAGQPGSEASAVQALAAGGAVLLWANASYFLAMPPTGWRRWLEGVLGISQAAGLLYCAIVLCGLWQKFAETLSAGPGE